jgi:hypothetical protein
VVLAKSLGEMTFFWMIEKNISAWFSQDACTGVWIMRNLAIGVLSRAGPVNLAAALRRHARDPHRPLATLGVGLR